MKRTIIALLAIAMLTGCATLAAQPVDESQAVAKDVPRILKLGYGAAQLQQDGTYKLLPLFVLEGSGIVLAPINGAPWVKRFQEQAKDKPVEGDSK